MLNDKKEISMTTLNGFDTQQGYQFDTMRIGTRNNAVYLRFELISEADIKRRPGFRSMEDDDFAETGYAPYGGIEVSWRINQSKTFKGKILFPVESVRRIAYNLHQLSLSAKRAVALIPG